MKKIILFFFSCLEICSAQNRNSIWCFGDSAGIDFTNITNPLPLSSSMDGRGSCISISDTAGNLLFYADTRSGFGSTTTRVYNSQHAVMTSGDSIRGEAWYNELVTLPINNEKYFLFSVNIAFTNTEGLYYSIIDMSQQSGLGSVIQKNIQINNFRNADCLTAIKHGNGRDWWLISKYSTGSTSYNRFNVYLIEQDSIHPPFVQDLNNAEDIDNQKIIFSPDGSKLMQISVKGFMCEYDFDRCTGAITNPNIIFQEQSGSYTRVFWEGAYSQNGNIFYVSTGYSAAMNECFLLQYDLTSANIPQSCDTLDQWQSPIGQGAVRRAPDGKIYFSRAYMWGGFVYPYPDSVHNYVNENLSVINSPDSLGPACNYQPFSFYLGGKRTYYGLPNNPSYSLLYVQGSNCDSLFNNVDNLNTSSKLLSVAPNPASQIIFIDAKGLLGSRVTIVIITLLGEKKISAEINVSDDGYMATEFQISNLSSGIYFLILESDNERLVTKFIKE